MMRSHLVLCLCVSVKGEILCSQKDFRINLFVPGEGDMILLTFRSVASTSLPHSDFAQLETQPPGTPHLTCSVLHDTFPPAFLPFFFLLDFHYFGFWFFFFTFDLHGSDAVVPVDVEMGRADAEEGGGDAADDFLPLELDNMEQEEEHVDRLQVEEISLVRITEQFQPPPLHLLLLLV